MSECDRPPAAERAYEVGDRRPPLSTRFRPGQSGNPRGRPRNVRGLSAIVKRALGEGCDSKRCRVGSVWIDLAGGLG
jgi:hypothetical protein